MNNYDREQLLSINSTNESDNTVDTQTMLLSSGKITITKAVYDNLGADLLRALSSSPNAEIEIIQD